MQARSFFMPVLLVPLIFISFSCKESSVETGKSSYYVSGGVFGLYNQRVPNATIEINGITCITSNTGYFSFSNISVPYDIYLKDSLRNIYAIYKNVDQIYPLIRLPISITEGLVTYNINVTLPPIPPTQKGKLYFNDASRGILATTNIDSSTNLTINTSPQLIPLGDVYLLTYTDDINGNIVNYEYFAYGGELKLTQGSTQITIKESNLIPIIEQTAFCNITLPTGTNSITSNFVFNISAYHNYNDFLDVLSLATHSLSVFQILLPRNFNSLNYSPEIIVKTQTYSGTCRKTVILDNNAANVDITISPPPVIITPQEYAVNIDSNTIFSFQKQPNISEVLVLTIIDSIENKTYKYCTTEDNFPLKNLSRILSLKPNRMYCYYVEQSGNGFNYNSSTGAYLNDGGISNSFAYTTNRRYFTTKP